VECRNDVSTLADRLRRQAPKSPAWLLLKARLFLLDRRWNEADQLLAEHCPRVHPQFACAELRLETSLESGAPAVHQQAILNLREVCGAPESCAMAEKAIADLYVERGWLREALGPLRRGAELLPSVDNWLGVAELAVRLGSRGEAERAMRRALEVNPGDSVARRVKEIRDRLAVQAPRE